MLAGVLHFDDGWLKKSQYLHTLQVLVDIPLRKCVFVCVCVCVCVCVFVCVYARRRGVIKPLSFSHAESLLLDNNSCTDLTLPRLWPQFPLYLNVHTSLKDSCTSLIRPPYPLPVTHPLCHGCPLFWLPHFRTPELR